LACAERESDLAEQGASKRFSTGTALLEKCCHDIDVANWMLGSIPRRVASFGGTNFFNPDHQHYVQKIGKSPDGLDAFFPGNASTDER